MKTPYQLMDLYYKSVGRGANFDLGISPDKRGLLDDHDVASLKKFGQLLRQTFAVNLAKKATFTASNIRGNNKLKFGPALLTDNNRYSYWATNDAVKNPQLVADLHVNTTFNVVRLRENIKLGQRITAFAIDAFDGGQWREIASATTIGANRLIRLPQNITARKVRLRITGSDACIALSDLGLFKEPAHLTAPLISRSKNGMVNINTSAPVNSIHYTIDGTTPGLASPVYQKPFLLVNGGIVKAVSFEADKKGSEVSTMEFTLSKSEWKVAGTFPQLNSKPEYAIDEDVNSVWATLQKDTSVAAQFPRDISIDLGKEQNIGAFTYLPSQDKKLAGMADRYIFYISNNGQQWEKAAEGEFANIRSNPVEQTVRLPKPARARYFKFSVLHVTNGNGVIIAELGIKVIK